MKDKEKQNCYTCVCKPVCMKTADINEKEMLSWNEYVKQYGCQYYQPKLPEDSVVLSKKEYDEFVESKRLLGCYIEDQAILLQGNIPQGYTVLSREEYNLLINIKKFFETADSEISAGNLLVYLKEFKEEEHKETAEQDFNTIIKALEERKGRVKAFYGVAESVGVDIAIRTVKELAKQFGLEIKE